MKIRFACMAGLALVIAACLENPRPDSRLGQEENSGSADIWGYSEPIIRLRVDRKPGGVLRLSYQKLSGTFDSAEVAFFGLKEMRIGWPYGDTLGMGLEHTGIIKGYYPGYMIPYAEVPDRTQGANLRNYYLTAGLLRSWYKEKMMGNEFGGAYNGTCRDFAASKEEFTCTMAGYITEDGTFFFHCRYGLEDPGASLSGSQGRGIWEHASREDWRFHSGNDTTARVFTAHGDTLETVFRWQTWNGSSLLDSTLIRIVRKPPPLPFALDKAVATDP